MNIVIVGHVDHGKSTLIGRLLYDTESIPSSQLEEIKKVCKELGKKLEFAYIVDALEEERTQEKTIDTTQTFFRSGKRDYTIIDAPGHKEFLKNMITGASYAEAAVLIVDVTESVRDQTKRHATILKLLGLKHVLVVINKMDLVSYQQTKFEQVKEQILDYLASLSITPAQIIPISAFEGDNVVHSSSKMRWYNGPTLLRALDAIELAKHEAPLRFAVQDVYQFDKKVIVGNVLSGELRVGDELKVLPAREICRVVEIIGEQSGVRAPKAVGVMLDREVKRGDILVKLPEPMLTKELNTHIFTLQNLREGDKCTLCCMCQEINCVIEKIDEKYDAVNLIKEKGNLKPAEVGLVHLKLERDAVLENFDLVPELGRFVLRKNSEIVAGGVLKWGS